MTSPNAINSACNGDVDCVVPGNCQDPKERAIVAAARQMFLAKGFDAASMDAIAMTANVSKRTVYNRFKSKEALFAAAILETCRQILPEDFAEKEASLPPLILLETLASKFVHGIFTPEAIALRRIAAFEAQRTPALGLAYLENGPRMMIKTCIPILQRLATRADIHVDDPKRSLWQLGALLTEPLYTDVLMGQAPENLEDAINAQIALGLAAFLKLHKIL